MGWSKKNDRGITYTLPFKALNAQPIVIKPRPAKVSSTRYSGYLKTPKRTREDPITKRIPVIVFARQPKSGIEQLIDCKPDCISLYWDESIDDSIKLLKNKTAIQGSFNPSILKEDNSIIYEEVKTMIEKFRGYPGYIFNLGHGITPDINPDKVKFLTDSVRGL